MPTPVWCFECEQAWSACWCRQYGKEPMPLYEDAADDPAHDCLADPRVKELVGAAKHFVRKCETGMAKSTESYAQFKHALRAVEGKEKRDG